MLKLPFTLALKIQQSSLGVYYAYAVSSTVQQSGMAVLKMPIHVLRLLCNRGQTDSIRM